MVAAVSSSVVAFGVVNSVIVFVAELVAVFMSFNLSVGCFDGVRFSRERTDVRSDVL